MENICSKCKKCNTGRIIVAKNYEKYGITFFTFSLDQATVFICNRCIKRINIKSFIGFIISGVIFCLMIIFILLEQLGIYNFSFIEDGKIITAGLVFMGICFLCLLMYLGNIVINKKYRSRYLEKQLNEYAQRIAIKRQKNRNIIDKFNLNKKT